MLSKRKIIIGLLSLTLLCWVTNLHGFGWAIVETAKAAGVPGPSLVDSIFAALGIFGGYVITFAHMLINICLVFINVLIDPQFMNLQSGDAMAEILLQIWQLTRNLTNIILAFLLIIGGIMTVVRAGDQYVKTYATKFVVAVILVNFSWFFPRVVLDISNVLTATIYSIPSAIPQARCVGFDITGNEQPCQIISQFSFFEDKKEEGGWECPIRIPRICVKYVPFQSDANHPDAIIQGLVVNYSRLRYMQNVIQGDAMAANPAAGDDPYERVKGQITYIIMMLMVIFFSVMLLFPLLAMMVILFIRIPVIWMTVAFMPLMFLGYVAGDLMKTWNPMEKIWNKFIKAAFLPAVIAIPFCIGFIMINMAMSVSTSEIGPGEALANMDISTTPIIGGVGNMWQLMWVAMSMLVIWLGVFQAMNFDPDLQKFVAPIQQAGTNFGKFFMKLPLLAPLPLPGMTDSAGNKMSMSGMQVIKAISNPGNTLAPNDKLLPFSEIVKNASDVRTVDTPKAVNTITNSTRVDVHQTNINNAIKNVNDATTESAQKDATQKLREAINVALKDNHQAWNGSNDELKKLMRQLRIDTGNKINAITEANLK
ncbi:MAG: hypothetical protein PHO54_00040 [Candidatus Peribacteraceae bacterium]|nr:hypothetical protein [Candidatus Peribacteraceae bacterium]